MTLASPLWDALSPAEKDVYSRRAKQLRGLEVGSSSGAASAGPRDTHGRSLQMIQERDREEKLRREKKMTDVDELVVQDKNGNLEDKPFFVIHANIFAKVNSFPSRGARAKLGFWPNFVKEVLRIGKLVKLHKMIKISVFCFSGIFCLFCNDSLGALRVWGEN